MVTSTLSCVFREILFETLPKRDNIKSESSSLVLLNRINNRRIPMKLKDDYIIYNASEEELIAIATGDEADNFNGLLRANKTAGAIMEYLKEDLTEDELVSRMLERFDAGEEEIREGVKEVLETLRSVGALEE